MDNYKYDLGELERASKKAYQKNKERIEQLEAESVSLQEIVQDLTGLIARLNERVNFLEQRLDEVEQTASSSEYTGDDSEDEDEDDEDGLDEDEDEASQYEEMLSILELDEHPTLQQIKNAYRRLSKEFHPDRGGDAQEFVKIQEAYEFLMARVSQAA